VGWVPLGEEVPPLSMRLPFDSSSALSEGKAQMRPPTCSSCAGPEIRSRRRHHRDIISDSAREPRIKDARAGSPRSRHACATLLLVGRVWSADGALGRAISGWRQLVQCERKRAAWRGGCRRGKGHEVGARIEAALCGITPASNESVFGRDDCSQRGATPRHSL
jgi:hypothetical protein